jgi:hypothetical protein
MTTQYSKEISFDNKSEEYYKNEVNKLVEKEKEVEKEKLTYNLSKMIKRQKRKLDTKILNNKRSYKRESQMQDKIIESYYDDINKEYDNINPISKIPEFTADGKYQYNDPSPIDSFTWEHLTETIFIEVSRVNNFQTNGSFKRGMFGFDCYLNMIASILELDDNSNNIEKLNACHKRWGEITNFWLSKHPENRRYIQYYGPYKPIKQERLNTIGKLYCDIPICYQNLYKSIVDCVYRVKHYFVYDDNDDSSDIEYQYSSDSDDDKYEKYCDDNREIPLKSATGRFIYNDIAYGNKTYDDIVQEIFSRVIEDKNIEKEEFPRGIYLYDSYLHMIGYVLKTIKRSKDFSIEELCQEAKDGCDFNCMFWLLNKPENNTQFKYMYSRKIKKYCEKHYKITIPFEKLNNSTKLFGINLVNNIIDIVK